jgi:DNA-binding LytR/AlgR family response regulator
MIRAISLENNANTRTISREFGGFEPALEPVREYDYSILGLDSNCEITPVYDQNDYILVKNEHKMIKLQVKDILFIEGKGNYVSIYTTKCKILSLQTMKKLESFLRPYKFIRVHKSFIVSFYNMDSLDKGNVFINNNEIPISDSYREGFRIFLAENARQI